MRRIQQRTLRTAWRRGISLAACTCLAACVFEAPVNVKLPAAGASGEAGVPGAAAGGMTGNGGSSSGSGGTPETTKPTLLTPELVFADSCEIERKQSQLLPSNLLFVVDRSGSMNCNPPPITSSEDCERDETRADLSQPSKWQLTTSALLFAIRTLPETTAIGVSYFSNDSACGVSAIPQVQVRLNNPTQRSLLAASVLGPPPNGPTPLVGATLLAYQYLHSAALSGDISGNRYAVLITDGEQSESCSVPAYCSSAAACSELLIQQTAIALGEGVNIRTFVIGVPGSERARQVLSRIAKAGGTAPANCVPEQGNCHLDLTHGADLGEELQRALQSIAGQTLTCELKLPEVDGGVVDLSRVNVVFTPHEGPARVIPNDLSKPCDSGADGWRYDPGQQQIRLCGNICTAVRNDRGGRLDVVLGCPVVGPD